MSEKEEKVERSRASTGSSTEAEETGSQIRALDNDTIGVPDIDHEDIEKITSGHSLDVELQSVC
jgi:hypothetical protein